mmetsp:Transcript_32270/g.43657  ORF Transcript_32270/g.43657 Transcript_32270/m.43657 type:complete len:81 (-) Transcript_32270:116-358(-)
MSYYMEARRHEQKLKKYSKEASKAASERRNAALITASDPHQTLMLEGRSVKIHKIRSIAPARLLRPNTCPRYITSTLAAQ